jgi:hypothetical protein
MLCSTPSNKALGWPSTQPCAYALGFESRSAQSHLSSFCTSSWAGCVLGFWWFPLYELHVYFSNGSEGEALSEYGVVTELFNYLFTAALIDKDEHRQVDTTAHMMFLHVSASPSS